MKKIDMIGKRFGKLLVIEESKERKNNQLLYKCLCECGNIHYVVSGDLRSNRVKSCGCLKHTHCKTHDRLYKIYNCMKTRCYNKHVNEYKNYGGRGIDVCSEWREDFMAFYNWAVNNGYKEGLTIDRVNVDGDYEPNNCRWVTKKQQANNRRNNIILTYKNKSQTLSQWADELGIKYATMYKRYKTEKSIEKLFTK